MSLHALSMRLLFSKRYSEAIHSHGSSLHLRLVHGLQDAIQDSGQGSAWFSSQPLTTAGSKRIFQLPVLVITVYFLYLTLVAWIDPGSQVQNVFEWSLMNTSFRFSFHGLSKNQLLSVGFLWNGCKSQTFHTGTDACTTSTYRNNSLAYMSTTSVVANGYFVTVSGMQTEPFKLSLEIASSKLNGSFQNFTMQTSEVFHLITLSSFENSKQEQELNVDLRLSWKAWSTVIGSSLISCIGFFSTFMAGRMGKAQLIRNILITTFFSVLMSFWVPAVGYTLDRENVRLAIVKDKITAWMDGIPALCFIIAITFFEKHFVYFFLVCGIIHILSRVLIFILTTHQNAIGDTMEEIAPLSEIIKPIALLMLSMAAVVFFFRQRALRRSLLLVRRERALYDEVWKTLANSTDSLAALKAIADGLIDNVAASTPRQCSHKSLAQRREGCLTPCFFQLSLVPDSADQLSPVGSLDQLFGCAKCLYPIFLTKVREWAMASNGLFPVRSTRDKQCSRAEVSVSIERPDEYVSLAADSEDLAAGAGGQRVMFAKIKSVERALEKLVRTYKQDVSRLLDLCRQTIVFADLSSLSACLGSVGSDREVKLCRVKNRMDPSYDPARSMGYRDVALNLQLSTPESRRLGCELHICELRLMLLPFAVLKTHDGHISYVRYRNIRGE